MNTYIIIELPLKDNKKHGYWVLSEDMKKVDLDKLSKNGVIVTNQTFIIDDLQIIKYVWQI